MRLQLKVKSNDHHVCTKFIKQQSLIGEVGYYLDKFKYPISINVSQLNSFDQELESSKKTSFSSLSLQKSSEQQYDVNVLSEQVILFESDKQIEDYIATQKLLAHDVVEKLGKLCKALILVANQQFQRKRSFASMAELDEKVQQKNITKEQLNEIEQKCMETLKKVQQERRKMQLCVVCWESMSNLIIMPCMHLVMCNKCPKVKICPVCKTLITSTAVVYR